MGKAQELSILRDNQNVSGLGTAFTYQGQLTEGNTPANGLYDFEFTLFDAVNGGLQVGSPFIKEEVTVANGLFTVEIDFGDVFDGTAAFLQIAVRPGSSTGSFTTLNPRQALTAVPYATFSKTTAWEGVSNVPPDLADGDDDTTYSAGFGLVVNGTEFNIDPNMVQARISGNCTVGQAIQAINADGTAVCATTTNPALTARQGYSHNIVDQSGDVGNDPSLTIGVDGMPIISHYVSDDDDLKVSHCNDPACNSATWTLVDTNGGQYSAITIGVDGLPLISYVNNANHLKAAHCHDVYCNSADIATVDATGTMAHNAITIGADGLGLISYQDAQNGLLKVAHCEQVDCSTQTVSTLVNSLGIGSDYISSVIGTDGLGVILYNRPSDNRLFLAHCENVICSTAVSIWVSPNGTGFSGSIAIGANGLPVFSFASVYAGYYRLWAGRCNDVSCTTYSSGLLIRVCLKTHNQSKIEPICSIAK